MKHVFFGYCFWSCSGVQHFFFLVLFLFNYECTLFFMNKHYCWKCVNLFLSLSLSHTHTHTRHQTSDTCVSLDWLMTCWCLAWQIIDNDCAYRVEGDVYFSVEKFPEYGRLSGRKVEDNRAGERVAVDSRKKNPADFALWKVRLQQINVCHIYTMHVYALCYIGSGMGGQVQVRA